eukprot:4817231-Alexandrium_andersonii.AAC.1
MKLRRLRRQRLTCLRQPLRLISTAHAAGGPSRLGRLVIPRGAGAAGCPPAASRNCGSRRATPRDPRAPKDISATSTGS